MTANNQLQRLDKMQLAEEIANAVTHGIGAALSIAGLAILVVFAVMNGSPWTIISVSIYGGSLVFLYLASTLFHAFQHPPVKRFFHVMDHIGIFLLIAGTYTPILLVKMRGDGGWAIFTVVWTLAITGSVLKAFFTNKYTRLSTFVYVAMGWLIIFFARSLIESVGPAGAIWTAVGGICYTLGVIPFMMNRLPFNHAIWHLFVIAGSVCHFYAILVYVVLP